MAARPLVLCLPDVCHTSNFFEPLKEVLSRHHYPLVALDLPSLVLPSRFASRDLGPDVDYIRSTLVFYLASSYDIIVVLHGYAGVAGSEALRPEYGKAERGRRGLNGGIVKLLYVMAWLPSEGFQMCERGDVSLLFPWANCDLDQGILTPDPNLAVSALFNDLPRSQSQYWMSQLVPQSLGVFWSSTTFAAWRYLPSTYVMCGNDRCVMEEYAQLMLRAATESGQHRIEAVERSAGAGHAPFLGQVEWLAAVVRRAAGEQVP